MFSHIFYYKAGDKYVIEVTLKKLQRRCYTMEGLKLLYMIKVPSFSCSSCRSTLINFAVPLNRGVQGTFFWYSKGKKNAVKSKNYRHMYQYSTGFCSAEIGLNP